VQGRPNGREQPPSQARHNGQPEPARRGNQESAPSAGRYWSGLLFSQRRSAQSPPCGGTQTGVDVGAHHFCRFVGIANRDAIDEHESVTIICPAAPEHGRTLYNGRLFVGDRLLSESSLARHLLTPMTDLDIVAVLSRQTPHPVALIPLPVVRRGSAAIAPRIAALRADGVRDIIVDALDEADLLAIAATGVHLGVITGSAGLAGALGKVLHDRDLNDVDPPSVPAPAGPIAIFAGSCSQATLGQVAHAIECYPSYRLDPRSVENTTDLYPDALAWLAENLGTTPVLMYSSAPASERGPADATVAAELERMMGGLAAAAVAGGAHRIIVAGGETSGAVVDALGVKAVLVNAEMDTGVPWCSTVDTNPVTLLLKSGNFGKPDLLVRAATVAELG